MFVYQDKAGNVCVTFTDNKPVEAPEYVIAIDEDAKALYMVSGTISERPDAEDDVETDESAEEGTPTGKIEDVAEEEDA